MADGITPTPSAGEDLTAALAETAARGEVLKAADYWLRAQIEGFRPLAAQGGSVGKEAAQQIEKLKALLATCTRMHRELLAGGKAVRL